MNATCGCGHGSHSHTLQVGSCRRIMREVVDGFEVETPCRCPSFLQVTPEYLLRCTTGGVVAPTPDDGEHIIRGYD